MPLNINVYPFIRLMRRNKITTIILFFALWSVAGAAWTTFGPGIVVDVPLEKGTFARVKQNGDDYYVSVHTPAGSLEKWMWSDLEIAQRTGLYLTPEGWVAALGGTVATFIAIPKDRIPAEVGEADRARTDSSKWIYLGAVDRDYHTGGLRFYGPKDQPECFDMFGAGESPYRSVAQWETACDCVQRAAGDGEACNMEAFSMMR